MTQSRLLVLGDGPLRDAVQAGLEEQLPRGAVIVSGEWPPEAGTALVLYCSARYSPQTVIRLQQEARAAGIPFLRVVAAFGEGLAGPLVDPREPGCVTCCERRRRLNRGDVLDADLAGRFLQRRPEVWTEPKLHPAAVTVLAALAAQEAAALVTGRGTRLRHAMYILNLDNLHLRRHRFLPDSDCPDCADSLPDSPDAARLVLTPRPKPAPTEWRLRPLSAIEADMESAGVVDGETGLVPAVANVTDQDLTALSTALLPLPGQTEKEVGIGRGLTYRTARTVAVLEALERYAGCWPRGKRTVVRASFRELGPERAVDPEAFGLHVPAGEPAPEPLVPYTPDLVMDWVWAYSFARQGPVLIPQQLAYYRRPRLGKYERYVYEISNGCALGSCLEEAIFHGLLEVIERDHFLLTWYAQLPLPPLDLQQVQDRHIRLLLSRFERAGYAVHAFDMTLDIGVPSVWVLLEGLRAGLPKALCIAAAHPSHERALAGALGELAISVRTHEKALPAERDRALRMLSDPAEVRHMEDHSLMYSLPEAFPHFRFLTDQARTAPPRPLRPTPPDLCHQDLREDLDALIQRFLNLGMDVLVRDQTAAEHRRLGLRVVKVLVPGMLPMTFGHRFRRVVGLPRLFTVPQALGYGTRTPADLNPYPHPFP